MFLTHVETAMPKMGPAFTLSQLIEKTADELRSLQKKPRPDAVIQFTGCELELAVTLSAGAKGELKFLLMGAWSADLKGETVSRIKLNFSPLPSGSGNSKREGVIGYGTPATGQDHSPITAEVDTRRLPSGNAR